MKVNKMTCKKFEKLISLYIYDELPDDQKASFESHVSACQACNAVLARYRRVRNLASETAAPVPVPDWDQAWLSVRRDIIQKRKPGMPRGHRSFGIAFKWAGALAASAAIFVLGLMVGVHVDSGETPLNGTNVAMKTPSANSTAKSTANPMLAAYHHEFQEHIENAKPVIIEYANYLKDTEGTGACPVERETVIELLVRNQQLMCSLPAGDKRDKHLKQLLNELNTILAKIAVLTADDPEALSKIKKMIRRRGLLFKMETLRPVSKEEISL